MPSTLGGGDTSLTSNSPVQEDLVKASGDNKVISEPLNAILTWLASSAAVTLTAG